MKTRSILKNRLGLLLVVLVLGLLPTGDLRAAGVGSDPSAQGLRGISFADTYSTGTPIGGSENAEHGLDWGAGLDTSVFSTTGDSDWLKGIALGVSESVTAVIPDSDFLKDGVSVGNVKLDRSLFTYGGNAERTRTILTALDRFAKDLVAVVPVPAAVPLILLIIIGVVAVRRRHG